MSHPVKITLKERQFLTVLGDKVRRAIKQGSADYLPLRDSIHNTSTGGIRTSIPARNKRDWNSGMTSTPNTLSCGFGTGIIGQAGTHLTLLLVIGESTYNVNLLDGTVTQHRRFLITSKGTYNHQNLGGLS